MTNNKIVYSIGISLDGFIEGPDADISWHKVDEELHTYFNVELARAGAFLEGRVTYELMASVWPAAREDSEPIMREFGHIWCDMPKVVYSTTLREAGWNTTIARRVDPDEVEAVKQQVDGDLIVGGPSLAAAFMQHGLVDEYRIYVHPVVIGRGTPAFPQGHREFDLVETRAFGNGVVMLRYQGASPS